MLLKKLESDKGAIPMIDCSGYLKPVDFIEGRDEVKHIDLSFEQDGLFQLNFI